VTHRVKAVAQLLALACVAGLLALLVWQLAHQQHPPPVGAIAPAFSLDQLDGSGPVSLASLRGRPVVLNFWASWCVTCKGEAPVLERDWNHYRSRGLVVLGIDKEDWTSDARRFVAAHRLTFPILEDGTGQVTGTYGVVQQPETYVLNRRGRIVAHLAGPITAAGLAARFRSAVARAVA
jgi:cytochrome c biogenesis protein CcmG/thiol:disulfide interchange protein DsbE